MPHPLRGTCNDCREPIDTAPDRGDEHAFSTSEVELFSPLGVPCRHSVVKRLVGSACGELAASHPIRFPAALEES